MGEDGDTGRIDFYGETASYISLLTSTNSGLYLQAYDKDGTVIDTAFAGRNYAAGTLTRLTVQSPTSNIAYAEVFDSGNYWRVDDICTDAIVCQEVPGYPHGPRGSRFNLVFVKDVDYDESANFLADVEAQISDVLLQTPLLSEGMFNFYYTPKTTGQSEPPYWINNKKKMDKTCGKGVLQSDFDLFCPYDAAVVIHTQRFQDCSWWNVLGAESTVEPDYSSLVHEFGHAMFGLGDEHTAVNYSGYSRTNTNMYVH